MLCEVTAGNQGDLAGNKRGTVADSEPELVGRVRRGDQQAFAELAQANRGPAWAVCLRITGSVHDAEDALQDALAAAWQNIHRFRGDSKFSTWFFRIAANAALAVVRRRAEVTEEAETIASSQSSVEELVTNADRVQSALLQVASSRVVYESDLISGYRRVVAG